MTLPTINNANRWNLRYIELQLLQLKMMPRTWVVATLQLLQSSIFQLLRQKSKRIDQVMPLLYLMLQTTNNEFAVCASRKISQISKLLPMHYYLCCDCSLSVTEYKHVYSISSTLSISQHDGFLFEIFPKLTRWCFLLKPKAMVLNTANIGSCLNPGTPNIRMHQTTVFSLKKWHLLFGRSEPNQLGHVYTNTQNKWVAPQSELRWR